MLYDAQFWTWETALANAGLQVIELDLEGVVERTVEGVAAAITERAATVRDRVAAWWDRTVARFRRDEP